MVLGSHAKTRAMYSTPPWPSLAASTAAYRRRSFSDNHPKKRCIFSSISAEYPSMLYSLRQNLLWRKDTPAQACREVILDHILSEWIVSYSDSYVRIIIFHFPPSPSVCAVTILSACTGHKQRWAHNCQGPTRAGEWAPSRGRLVSTA